jgi:hypothetical protein
MLARDLSRSDSKPCACSVPDTPEVSGFAAASVGRDPGPIVGKVERHPGSPTPSAEAVRGATWK